MLEREKRRESFFRINCSKQVDGFFFFEDWLGLSENIYEVNVVKDILNVLF